jgi:hypothetical protein
MKEDGMDHHEHQAEFQNVLLSGGQVRAPNYYTTTKMMQSLNDSMKDW